MMKCSHFPAPVISFFRSVFPFPIVAIPPFALSFTAFLCFRDLWSASLSALPISPVSIILFSCSGSTRTPPGTHYAFPWYAFLFPHLPSRLFLHCYSLFSFRVSHFPGPCSQPFFRSGFTRSPPERSAPIFRRLRRRKVGAHLIIFQHPQWRGWGAVWGSGVPLIALR